MTFKILTHMQSPCNIRQARLSRRERRFEPRVPDKEIRSVANGIG